MTFELVNKLLDKLMIYCPVDTGQLRASIQLLQLSEYDWLLTIGNEDGSMNGTPSNQYASLLNNEETIKGRPNRHYHWVNKAIDEWVNENLVRMTLELEE